MIDMLFKTVTKTEIKTVYKTRREKKLVLVAPAHYNCGRCGKDYKPGDNRKDSEKCPNCVCDKCGRSLMNRPSHHRVCGICWGMGSLGYSYSFESKHVEAKYEYKYVDITEEVEEPYTFEEKEMLAIADIPYVKKNKVIRRNFDISEVLGIDIGPKNVEEYEYWYGVKELSEAIKKYTKKATISAVDTSGLREIEPNIVIVDEKQELIEFNDVVGFYPDVPAYIMGHPLNMFNNIRRNVQNLDRQLNIWINATIDSKYSKDIYKYKGIATFALWKHLSNLKVNTEIRLLDCSFVEGETLLLECRLVPEYILMNEDLVYEVLTEASFLRVFLRAFKDRMILEGEISRNWRDGMGYEIKDADLRRIIEMEENDILINDVSFLNINGKRVASDFHEMMKSLGLLSL